MKRFEFPLDQFQLSRLTSAFRSKKDVIVFWMNCIKIILSYSRPNDAAIKGSMILRVDKMSRVFLQAGEKSFSICFPFTVYEGDHFLEFGSAACPIVDNKITSDVLLLINGSNILESRTIFEFADPLMELVGEQEIIWELLRDLMITDDGYLRIDHDPVNVNGYVHPLDHIDIFYSQSATFKIGMRGRTNLEEFHDILNISSDCRFLGRP